MTLAQRDGRLPLYEGKYFHHYEHRWVTSDAGRERSLTDAERFDPGTFTQTRHWYPAGDALARFGVGWTHPWVFAWRDIARSTDERTFIAAVIPSLAVPDTAKVMFVPDELLALFTAFIACVGSFPFDFIARQKTGGTHMSGFIVEQLPVFAPTRYHSDTSWSRGTPLSEWLTSRVLELTYTAWDLEPFARAVGHKGTPFRWDSDRRFQLRCELDAAFFHLYGLAQDDVEHVMDSFPVVRKNDEKAHGHYRTKRVILETYDALAKAAKTGRPYRTPLDPPPAAPEASHGWFVPGGTPSSYAEALRTGLLFTLIRRSGEAGIPQGTLSRALLWLQDAKHAKAWFEEPDLAAFEAARAADPLLTDGVASSQTPKLLDALEGAKAITRDAKGIVRRSASGVIPNWLPQTPGLAKFASTMSAALARAEQGAAMTPAIEKAPTGKAKQA